MASLFERLLRLTIFVIGNGHHVLFAGQQDEKKEDLMIIERSLPKMFPHMANYTPVVAAGVRGFDN
jgi:hypothetical protein